MKKNLLLPIFLFFTQTAFSQAPVTHLPEPSAYSQMGFEENKGQLADKNGNLLPDVLFKSSGTGPGIYITTSGLTYVFVQHAPVANKSDESSSIINWAKIDMKLINASIKKENIVCENATPGFSNFYYAHCPQGILKVKTYQHITIKNIYPGIDWVFNVDAKIGLSHDFIVHPDADPSQIRMMYSGMDLEKFNVDQQKRLALVSQYGTMYEGGLHVYEKETGRVIDAGFETLSGIYGCMHVGIPATSSVWVGYELGDYSNEKTLVIDPPLQWSVLQASTDFDYGYAISAAHDGSGDVLTTGTTYGSDFPTINAYQGTLSGTDDMVIQRLSAAGTRLWSTYYGGSSSEQGKSIASDILGNCYVAGNTSSSNFPTLTPTQVAYGGGNYDVAILKLNSSGVRQWATWYGGLQTDNGNGITVDGTGTVYVTGATNSSTFPTLTALQSSKGIGYDAFLIKMSTLGLVQWATFFGGDDDDKGRAITLDATAANVYVTGSTLAGGFPVTAGAFQTSSASAYNAEEGFVLKMTAAQTVGFASYCGGSDADFGQGIAVDASNNIYVTGYTLSSDFPIANPGLGAYVDSTIGSIGTHDGFVMMCNPTGSARVWSTYFGGSSPDLGFAIAYDAAAGIYICGNTSSTDFPTHQPVDLNYYQSVQGDAGSFNDVYIAWFGANHDLKWSTYYGDANSNEAYGICVDATSNIFTTGVSNNEMEVVKFGPGFTAISSAESAAGNFSIYPNPANNVLNLQFENATEGPFTFELINLQGQLLFKTVKTISAANGNSMEFDLSSYASGTYFLKINYPSGASEVLKFVRE